MKLIGGKDFTPISACVNDKMFHCFIQTPGIFSLSCFLSDYWLLRLGSSGDTVSMNQCWWSTQKLRRSSSTSVQGGPKIGTIVLYAITLPNIKRFSKNYFAVRIRRKFVIILSPKIPPNLKCVVTEWGKLSQRFIGRAIGQWRRQLKCVV